MTAVTRHAVAVALWRLLSAQENLTLVIRRKDVPIATRNRAFAILSDRQKEAKDIIARILNELS